MRFVALLSLLLGCRDAADATRPPRTTEGASNVPARDAADSPVTRSSSSSAARSCTNEGTQRDALWAQVEANLLGALNAAPRQAPEASLMHGIRQLRTGDDAFEGRAVVIDSARVAAFVSYECGSIGGGGRLWLMSSKSGGAWLVADVVRLPDDEHVSLLASAPGGFVVSATRWSTQHTVSRVAIVRPREGRWTQVFAHDGLVNLFQTTKGDIATLTWSEPLRAFARSVVGPMRGFEMSVDVDASEAGRPAVRALTPWLDALDSLCEQTRAVRRSRVPCGSDTAIVESRRVDDYVAVRLEGATTNVDCGREAPGSGIAGDRSVVVELARATNDRWDVIDVRTADRGCATTLDAQGARSRSEVIARVRRDGAFYASGSDAYSASGESLRRHRSSSTSTVMALRDVAEAIAVDDDGVYWISRETARLRRAAWDGDVTTLVEAPAMGTSLIVAGRRPIWASYARGEIRTWEVGRVRVIASGLDAPWGMASKGNSLLIATAEGIVEVTLSTGEVGPTQLPALAPVGVAATDRAVAWTEAGGRVMVVEDGGAARVLAQGGRPTQVGFVDGAVVWLDASDGSLRRATL